MWMPSEFATILNFRIRLDWAFAARRLKSHAPAAPSAAALAISLRRVILIFSSRFVYFRAAGRIASPNR